MKIRIVVALIAATLGVGKAYASDGDCPEGKSQTCFVDGSGSQCVCVDPAPASEENPPNPPDDPIEGGGEE